MVHHRSLKWAFIYYEPGAVLESGGKQNKNLFPYEPTY